MPQVALKPIGGDSAIPVDTLEKAIQALDDLGLCMNWATLIPGEYITQLIYEGLTFRRSHERFVELPFNPNSPDFAERFRDLLNRIFNPFLVIDPFYRSLIHVEKRKDRGGGECFLVNLLLMFQEHRASKAKVSKAKVSKAKVIEETLRGVADAESKAEAINFHLD